VTFTNQGGTATGVPTPTLSGANAGDFQISATTCTAAVPALGSCTVTVGFTPSAAGTRVATLQLSASPGGTASVALRGTGIGVPQLSIMPAMLDFGLVQPNMPTPPKTFTITNTGNGAATALTVQVSGTNASEFSTSGTCAGLALAPGSSCDINVVFQPSLSVGSHVANVDVSAANVATLHGPVTGSCCLGPQLTLTPSSKDFGPLHVGASSAVQRFTLTNNMAATTSAISVSIVGTNANDFRLEGTTCGAPLANLDSCTIDVTMRPVSTGLKSAALQVTTTFGGSPSATLMGTGVAGAISATPSVLDFGNVPSGTPAQTQDVTFMNNAAVATGTPAFSISGANPGDFQVASTTCTAPIPPSGTCTATIGFTPSAAGNRTATVQLTASPGGIVSIAVAGNGT
jgi:hypothetical protein